MQQAQQNQDDKSKLGQKLGLIFGIMIIIILALNFSSLRTLNTTQDNLNSITRSFEYLVLLKQLESQINREFREFLEIINIGKEELEELEEVHESTTKTFQKILTSYHLQETQKKIIAEIHKNYLTLNEQMITAIESWKETGQLEPLQKLQFNLEEEFDDRFFESLRNAISLEQKKVEEINQRTREHNTFEIRLASTLVAISIFFAIFAYFYLRKSVVSRRVLESTNIALHTQVKEKDETKQKLYRERQNLYQMLDSLPMAFHLQAPDYTVPFANKVFRERFGNPQKRHCYDLMHKRSQPCEVCTTFKVFDHGGNETTIWDSTDGHTYITVCTPFTDIDGSPLVMEMALGKTPRKKPSRPRKRLRYPTRQKLSF